MRRRVGDDPSWRGATIAGVDEAGRGPLAGPVAVAAVVLDPARRIDGLRDSKAIPEARREVLFPRIQSDALAFAIVLVHADEIDRLNILQATLLAMRRAVAALEPAAQHVLVDGNRLPDLGCPARAVVGGDARVAAISAASIVAKVHRDRLCVELDQRFPGYGFALHKGYGTASHIQALREKGPCSEHRRSFEPLRSLLTDRG